MDEIELASKIGEVSLEILQECQESAVAHSMERREPQMWLDAAKALMEGKSQSWIAREICNGNVGLVRRVNAQIMSSPVVGDLKKELAIRAVEVLNTTSELRQSLSEKFLEKMDKMSDEEVQAMSITDYARAFKDLGFSEKMDTDTLSRLRGENVQKIEVQHKVSDEDIKATEAALLEKLEKQRAAKEADVIDVTDCEGEE